MIVSLSDSSVNILAGVVFSVGLQRIGVIYMFDEPPAIIELCKSIPCQNPISGHCWNEQGETIGYQIVGGGWMPEKFKSLRLAEKELALRKQILAERAARGE